MGYLFIYFYILWVTLDNKFNFVHNSRGSFSQDYDSVAAVVPDRSAVQQYRPLARTDGSYELLGSGESNIGGLRMEDLQQNWPIAAVLRYKTDIHMIYKVKGGPWRKAKAYAIRPDRPSPTFSQHWATSKSFVHRETLMDNFPDAVSPASAACSLTAPTVLRKLITSLLVITFICRLVKKKKKIQDDLGLDSVCRL